MATLILEIPDDRLDELKRLAECEGLSVDEFLIRDTKRMPSGSTAEFWNRLRNLPRVDIGPSSADMIREGREERDRQIDEWLSRR
ncbi:MAG TPA: hypothetical protein VN380_24910 [Thermoanaerobaculia bacterium]|jgi:hypothetical protein|nr:hypothetical protein [Thermoanaerobaculia bacterium]